VREDCFPFISDKFLRKSNHKRTKVKRYQKEYGEKVIPVIKSAKDKKNKKTVPAILGLKSFAS
jgi:hypothetical protein